MEGCSVLRADRGIFHGDHDEEVFGRLGADRTIGPDCSRGPLGCGLHFARRTLSVSACSEGRCGGRVSFDGTLRRSLIRLAGAIPSAVIVVLLGLFPSGVFGQEPPGQDSVERAPTAPDSAVHEQLERGPYVQITFLDVGQGDAVVIRAPGGQTAMIDAGRGSPLRQLQRMGVEEVDLLVATHPHADHIGGLDDVLTARPVRFYMDNGRPHTTDTYRRLMATIERLDVTYLEAVPRSIDLGEVVLDVLPLPEADLDHNDRSVGLVLRFGAFSALLTGDSERRELDYWLRAGVIPPVTLLKAPHHGAANGINNAFLEASTPKVVVISVGADNQYLHPRPEALTAFGSIAERIVRTDLSGHVTVLGYADGSYEIAVGDEFLPLAEVGDGDESLPVAEDGERRVLSLSVYSDEPGAGPEDLNAEYVVILNRSADAVEIGRWSVCDISSRCFRFPDDARIAPGRRVVVYTGYGMSDGVSFFMNNDRAVWNDNGDEATLFDSEGKEVVRYVYE